MKIDFSTLIIGVILYKPLTYFSAAKMWTGYTMGIIIILLHRIWVLVDEKEFKHAPKQRSNQNIIKMRDKRISSKSEPVKLCNPGGWCFYRDDPCSWYFCENKGDLVVAYEVTSWFWRLD